MADDKPIIVIKKKGGHGGHHGGAWKIAYADFVTAMMCFFLVMWLVNSADVKTKAAIATYFRKPVIFTEGSGTPLKIGAAGILPEGLSPPKAVDQSHKRWEVRQKLKTLKEEIAEEEVADKLSPGRSEIKPKEKPDQSGISIDEPKKREEIPPPSEEKKLEEIPDGKISTPFELERLPPIEKKQLSDIAHQVKDTLLEDPLLKKSLGEIQIQTSRNEITIEIMDTEKVSMFTSGSATILPEAQKAFQKIAETLKPLPNKIEILGHTDSKPFSKARLMSNWELSQSRANEARKLLQQFGISPERIVGVIGRADRELKNKGDPFAAANRRITLRMLFNLDQTAAGANDQKIATQNQAGTPSNISLATPTVPSRDETAEALQQGLNALPQDNAPKVEIYPPEPLGNPPIAPETEQRLAPNQLFGSGPVFGPDDLFNDL